MMNLTLRLRTPLLRTLILIAALGSALLMPAPATAQAPLRLTVLHNNDGETNLIGAPNQPNFGGAARFKTLVDSLKRQAVEGTGIARGVVTLTSGDNFLAGAQLNASFQRPANQPWYDGVVHDSVGYDAICIGNHDFDFGPDSLARFINSISARPAPFMCANANFVGEPVLQALVNSGRIKKSHIVTVAGQQVGIIGAITPLLPTISTPRNVIITEVIPAIQAEITALTNAGVNKIILISHLQAVREDSALATQLTGVDIMIAGGGDDVLVTGSAPLVPGDAKVGDYPKVVNNASGVPVPIITTGGDYKYVGRLVVEFDAAGNITTTDVISNPVRVAGGANADSVTKNTEMVAQVENPVSASVAALQANVIGISEVPLDGRNTGNVGIRQRATNEGDLVADALLWQARQLAPTLGVSAPQIALQNGGGIRNASIFPAGNFTEFNTFQALAFTNLVSIVPNVPPDTLKDILERAVSGFPVREGRFPQIAGFKLTFDPTATAQVLNTTTGVITTPGARVRRVELDNGTVIVNNGAVVAGAPNVSIATIDFLCRTNPANGIGGDGYPFRNLPYVTSTNFNYQRALLNYVSSAQGLAGVIPARLYPFNAIDSANGSGRIKRTTEARVQVIHNCADPAAATVDVYLNGTRAVNDLAFRSGTGFFNFPAGSVINVGIAPGTSTSVNDTLKNFQYTLTGAETYTLIASGVLNPASFAVNPNGRSTAFDLLVKSGAREVAADPTKVEFFVVHGATDAPTVDVEVRTLAQQRGAGTKIVDNASYSDITNYIAVDPGTYTLDVSTSSNDQYIAAFVANLSGLGGGAAVVQASGFLTPAANQNGAAFGLIAGTTAGGSAALFTPTAALPVELADFKASSVAGGVSVSWKTLSEKNNAGFYLQRSKDKATFEDLTFVAGKGTTTEARSYSFTDNLASVGATGKVFYRLKQVDFDGTTAFSEALEITVGVPAKFALNQNYPNPFNPTTSINYDLARSADVSLKVYDMLGREVATLVNSTQEAGRYSVRFNAATFSSGLYFYRIQAGAFTETRKMLLVK